MIDGHVHLEKGPLTREYVHKFIDVAIDRGIDDLQILDHTFRFKEFLPLYEPYRINKLQDEWLKKCGWNSIYEYIDLIEEIKKEDLPIKVSFGLEVDYQPGQEELIKKLLSVYNWDFVVGGVHAVDYVMYDCEWSKELLWTKKSYDEIYKEYYDDVLKLVESSIFSQLAHPDTIKMFNYYPTYDLKPTYEKLAKLLNEKHMKVENNVGCYYRYNHSDMGLADDLLQIFKDNHCNLITVSDAHYPEHVGIHIKDIWNKTMK